MEASHEAAAVEKDAAIQALDKPAAVIAAMVGASKGAAAATGGGAPSAVTAPAAVAAVQPMVGEQVNEEVAVDLEEQKAKRKRKQYEFIEKYYYEEAEVAAQEVKDEAVEFEEEVDDKLPDKDDEDVDDSKERRDNKSRYVLRRLRNGEIPYRSGPNRLYGDIACPFCCARIKNDYDSLIMHGPSIGRGNGRNRKPHVRAKHAAFGAFLMKYAKGHLPFYLLRPPRPAKMPRI